MDIFLDESGSSWPKIDCVVTESNKNSSALIGIKRKDKTGTIGHTYSKLSNGDIHRVG